MILLTCLLLFLVLFCLVIWLPLVVEVDTEKAIYRAGWKGIFIIKGIPGEKGWRWFYQLFFFKKEWSISLPTAKPPSEKQPSKQRKSMSPRQIWQLFKRSLKAVQIKRLRINWDTNDYITNAYLYPLSHFLGNSRHRFQINFTGKQELSVLLQARPYRLLLAFLQSFFYHKKAL